MKMKSLLSATLCIIFFLNMWSSVHAENNNVLHSNKQIESFINEADNILMNSSPQNMQCYDICIQKQQVHVDDLLTEINNLHIKVEDYLNSFQNNDIYNSPSLEELVEKLDKLDLKANSLKSKKYDIKTSVDVQGLASTSSSKNWRYGDILYYGVGSDNAAGEPSFTGHTAVLSTTDYYVIEASKTSNSGNKVHHWNRSNLWKGASGIKQYKVTNLFGKDASATQRKEAVNFGLKQKGDPYKLKTALWTNDYWYCSKLTMRQWYSAGYDLRGARGMHLSGYVLVIPLDIRIDANTRLVKDWGSTLPSKI
ncbi:YiiX/YebB-like N1pC/P60 family cysteine hydrolase [Bacillus kexueae]|uniref:YiiX/YebB-like N1pC/P60 family cysteine hydrolase n=1 Tax=Aeribacillus kexueae TaxID=2078952 RepID=UPI001FAFB1CE|nr:YiiX/YebB-like N1pC/P60 family cysteine hydrolase [Bacillus kexueae]